MNKKGFTLIEILAVITLLSILIVVVVPNTVSLVKDRNEQAYNQMMDVFESAAALYVEDRIEEVNGIITLDGKYMVSLSTLANLGLIKNEYINPITATRVSLDKQVTITKSTSQVFLYCFEDRTTCPTS